ncbi:GAF and ANTAR domain-containing protein [Paractinoplanes maris]|uniref:GAF and ANTAR domain-containing protein n=1 Tax=Paractinoplanes maris TaxID=1734446 RepID=UPI0020213EF4|nr:GAF and ANTAR domain-containing protein [Actinoplanes maris]
MTQQGPAPSLAQDQRLLARALVTLAGTPDDYSGLEGQLITIAQLTAQRVAAVSYASVTAQRDGAYTTVAASNDIATAVDEAQYAEGAGPCLEAMETARPLSVPDIAATMRWPGFRDTAYRLGLHTSLSVPLFAGRGEPVAALNLYGHDTAAMAALTAAVWAAYDDAAPVGPDHADLDPGGRELVDGLAGAFRVRATIQQAIGATIARHHSTPGGAYAMLRLRAADTGASLPDVAGAVLGEQPD